MDVGQERSRERISKALDHFKGLVRVSRGTLSLGALDKLSLLKPG